MDAKFMRRYESFRKSLDALNEAKERDMADSFVLSGTSAKFCITFDLCWKLMKDILIQHYAISDFVAGSPKEVLRKGFQAEMIAGDVWMEMLTVRNSLTHDYDNELIKQCCGKIVSVYIDLFYDFKETVMRLVLSCPQRSTLSPCD